MTPSDILKKVSELQAKIKTAETETATLSGKESALLDQLEKLTGTRDVEAAGKLRDEWLADIGKLSERAENLLSQIEQVFDESA